jgi:glycosyltransferase involved in cell wall biosynthesis
VVCVSDAVKRPLLRHYGFASRKLSTVHNGIDVAKYRPDPERHATARRAWGVPPEAFVFGAVGRLARVKGLATAIDLFARLLEETRRSDLWLVLVGDGPERPALECRAREKGAAARVVFPGFTDAPEEAYPGIDTFVMPSRNEGLPLALVEAMASGCCPIAMGVGGVPEVIVNPSIGWLIAPSAEEDFFQAMAAASRLDRQAAADMGRRARGYVLAHFDERVQLAALADIIDSAARS